MHVAVLAASGATGRQLALQALDRGHTVTALARDLTRLDLPASDRLHRSVADVNDPTAIQDALAGVDAVVSGLGTATGNPSGILTAGAKAVVVAGPPRIVWLGAFGTGPSGPAAGALTRAILAVALRSGIPDKTAADALVLDAGGTVLHAGPLTRGPLTPYRTHGLADVPLRLIVATISRATVAAAMLDEAETGAHPSQVLVPLRTGRPSARPPGNGAEIDG